MRFRSLLCPSRALARTLAASVTLSVAALGSGAHAAQWTLSEENDGIGGNQDRHYTQGARITYLSPRIQDRGFTGGLFDAIGTVLPMYRSSPENDRRFVWLAFDQSIFTPENIGATTPDPHDRPYAAWLNTGIELIHNRAHRHFDNLELQLGIVGPDAIGKEIQDGAHSLFGYGQANGWDHQLRDRAAYQISWDHKERFGLNFGNRWGVDAVPEAGVSLGNVFRYAQAGTLLRFGNALKVDYGAPAARPALSGTDYVDTSVLPNGFHFNVFIGVQGRRMWYNTFIDRSGEVSSIELARRQWVADFLAGATLYFNQRFHADFTLTRRTWEFAGQTNHEDQYGTATLSYNF